MKDATQRTAHAGLRVAACLIGSSLLLPSAFAQKVDVNFDKDFDFSKVKKYGWRTHPYFEKHPEMKERYETGISLVMQASNERLMKKGLQSTTVSPDVFVTFFLGAEPGQRTVITSEIGEPWGTPWGWYGTPIWTTTSIERYVQGMLVMDIVDAKSMKLIWRAYCGDSIEDWRERDKNINKTVRKALDKFPPKQK